MLRTWEAAAEYFPSPTSTSTSSLRHQLLCRFVVPAALVMVVLVMTAAWVANRAGAVVVQQSRTVMEEQVISQLVRQSRAVAEQVAANMESVTGALQIIVESVQDRIVGYPDVYFSTNNNNFESALNESAGTWRDDAFVPFYNAENDENEQSSQQQQQHRHQYPIKMPIPPLDWEIKQWDPYPENRNGYRGRFAKGDIPLSLETGVYFFQGSCDPEQRNASVRGYMENCTTEHNTLYTGGIVHPTELAWHLQQQIADITPVIKAVYEAQEQVVTIGVYFINAGAGSVFWYPGQPFATGSYISRGCDWWSTTINPHTQRPFGTAEEETRCHPKGTVVPIRHYNPLDRKGFRECIINYQHPFYWYGPYNTFDTEMRTILACRGVYDRITGELIGVVTMDLSMTDMTEQLKLSRLHHNMSDMAIVRYHDDSVFADTMNLALHETVAIYNTSFISHADYERLRQSYVFPLDSHMYDNSGIRLQDTDEPIQEKTTGSTYENKNATGDDILKAFQDNVIRTASGGVFTAFPLPLPPVGEAYDPNYHPHFLLLHYIPRDIFSSVDEMQNRIHTDWVQTVLLSTVLGVVGTILVFGIVWGVARMLTRPLLWIESVAWSILHHHDERAATSLQSEPPSSSSSSLFTPQTEIHVLVAEFQAMVHGFSGPGASHVAESTPGEIPNIMTWRSDFQQLYAHAAPPGRTSAAAAAGATATKPKRVSSSSSAASPSPPVVPTPTSLAKADLRRTPTVTSGTQSSSKEINLDAEPSPETSLIGSAPAGVVAVSTNVVESDVNLQPHDSEADLSPVIKIDESPKTPDNPAVLSFKTIVPAPPKKNLGRNIIWKANKLDQQNRFAQNKETLLIRSSLFWWILILIVIPLVCTNALICALVSQNIMNAVPHWISIVEQASSELEINALVSYTYMKASVAEAMLQEVIRDLHVETRMAAWLLFDGVQRTGIVVETEEATEDCKNYPPGTTTCPYFSSGRTPCSCDWPDQHVKLDGRTCTHYNASLNTRPLQRRFWNIQKTDADAETGNRTIITTFPELSSSPNTTFWWNSADELPGSSKKLNAAGYQTAYDRIRVTSVMALVDIPIYNYAKSLRRPSHHLGTFIGFEADGGFTGYQGCAYQYPFMAWWSSTEENNAAGIAPNLCPLGKYGYDCRCREWYATGKSRYQSSKQLPLFITPPYPSPDGNIASTATSPIANPATGEYVGQTALDFVPSVIYSSIRCTYYPVSFLVTPAYDANGGNTVFGPGKSIEDASSVDIVDLLFVDDSNTLHKEDFRNSILPNFTSGVPSMTKYKVQRAGGEEQTFYLSYQPVYVSSYLPISPNNFGRGVTATKEMVYVVGLAATDDMLVGPFQNVKKDVSHDHERLQKLYFSIVDAITILFIIYACTITVAITRSIMTLLRVVQTINSGSIKDDLPPLQGGSREVQQVYNSFAKLIKIVRMSNVAFFSGNLDWAHNFISDALKLFRTIGDKKAIAIACNNLGNTLYAKAQEARRLGDIENSTHFVQEYEIAVAHFDEAIALGQQEFDDAVCENDKADYAQQLADRLFNRCLFNLLAWNVGHATDEIKEATLADLARVRELDNDIKDFWLERKLLLKNSSIFFSRLIRRIHGLIDFYEDEDVLEIWEPKELIDEADQLLSAAWNEPNASIFDDYSPVGRLQQLEGAAMRLDLLLGKTMCAAKLAMRMFAEDEYLLETGFTRAAKSLLEHMRDDASAAWSVKTKTSCREDLRNMLRYCKNSSVDLGKCVVLGLEINEIHEGDPILDMIHANCMKLYDTFFCDDDHFGLVAYTMNGELNVKLCQKGENEGRQRAGLDIATISTSDRVCPSLHYATQMMIDSAASTENDSYIIIIADGYSWDPASFFAARSQLERLNSERSSPVHVLILGLEVEETEAIEAYKSMSSMTKLSLYTEVTKANINSTFAMVGSIISGRSLAANLNQSITMEKF